MNNVLQIKSSKSKTTTGTVADFVGAFASREMGYIGVVHPEELASTVILTLSYYA